MDENGNLPDPQLEIERLRNEIKTLKDKLDYESVGRTRAEKMLRTKLLQDNNNAMQMRPIGTIKSCFNNRFGTPRQGSLAGWTRGIIKIDRSVVAPLALTDLEGFSHIWILFIFHENTNMHKLAKADDASVKHKKVFPSFVRPPQAGGKRVGLFATRTPHRPNPIGLSLAKITKVDLDKGTVHVSGIDLIDGTPIIDIKPYVLHVDNPCQEYLDTLDPAVLSTMVRIPPWVTNPKFETVPVTFTEAAMEKLELICTEGRSQWFGVDETQQLKETIEQIIALDPRGVIHGRGAFAVDESEVPVDAIEEVDLPKHLFRDKFVFDFDTFRIRFCASQTSREIIVYAIEQ